MTRRRRRSRTGSNRRRRGRGKARLDWRMASLVLGSVGVVSLVGIAAIPSAVEFMNRPKVPQVALGAPLAEDTLVRGVVLDPSGSNGGTQSAQKDLERPPTLECPGWT